MSDVIFLDTSIYVAQTIRQNKMRQCIQRRVSQFKLKVTSSVVVAEFKRRVLKDVAYLLAKLHRTQSYGETLEHVTNVLPSRQQRKKNICIPLLHKILPAKTDEELTERGLRYLRVLLMQGEKLVRAEVDNVLRELDCYCASLPIRERKMYRDYDLGDRKCSKYVGLCPINRCFAGSLERCENVLKFLASLPPERRTSELAEAQQFLERLISDSNPQKDDPCLTVGDLLIALESDGCPNFYTMNYAESQAYCDHFDQNLIIRPNNSEKDDLIYPKHERPWPSTRSSHP